MEMDLGVNSMQLELYIGIKHKVGLVILKQLLTMLFLLWTIMLVIELVIQGIVHIRIRGMEIMFGNTLVILAI